MSVPPKSTSSARWAVDMTQFIQNAAGPFFRYLWSCNMLKLFEKSFDRNACAFEYGRAPQNLAIHGNEIIQFTPGKV